MTIRPSIIDLPPGWRREHPDSAGLPRPRILLRHLVGKAELAATANAYEHLLAGTRDIHMPIPGWGGLEIVVVSNVILIASDTPFTETQRRTLLSAVVPDIGSFTRRPGVSVIPGHEPEDIPPGIRARCDFGGAVILEAVQHIPLTGESARPPAQRPRHRIRLTVTEHEPAFVTGLAAVYGTDPAGTAAGSTMVGDFEIGTAAPAGSLLFRRGFGLCGGIGTAAVVPADCGT